MMLTEAHAEDAVLIASTVPGYVPGMVISSVDRLSIPDGAIATLLFESGEMLRLRGPFEGTLGQQHAKAGESNLAALVDMFRLHGVDATVLGGTRSAGPGRNAVGMDDVEVDPQRSATYCVEPATTVWIARPAIGEGVYTLRRKGRTRTLGWPAGADRTEWPADVPIEDASQFEIAADGTTRSTVTFHTIPPATGSIQVAKGLLLGCHEQFDYELSRIRQASITPDVWISTDRGRRPTYRPGEPIGLTVTSDVDGYLYCVAIKDDGGAMPIFPSGAVDGAQLRGSAPLAIPGRRQPVGLTAFPGLAQVHCWLADRDITPELPHSLLGTAGRLPDQVAADLDTLFSRVGGPRVASDVLMVHTD
jgi:hypothetical protein